VQASSARRLTCEHAQPLAGNASFARPIGGFMTNTFTHRLPADAARTMRVRAVSLLGPSVVAAGLIWAILQPYRLTLLHPRGQGFWWLLIEPPLLVVVAGTLFALVVARPLLADLEAHDATAR
jgi:hypothetical protein